MHAEEAVEVDDLIAGDGDRGTRRVVRGLAVRHNDVQTINRAALENGNEHFVALRRRRLRNLDEHIRQKAAGDQRQPGSLEKKSSIDHCR